MRRATFIIGLSSLLVVGVADIGAAQTYEVLHAFPSEGKPVAGLLRASDGNLYGTTSQGGPCGAGTIFRVDGAGSFRILHEFCGLDGRIPHRLIQASDGNLFGITGAGGASDHGTVFRMDLAARLQTIHEFDGTDGSGPYGALLQAADGRLYGATVDGQGTLFRIETSGANFTTLHEFQGDDGVGPTGDLIQSPDGSLYGTTIVGGSQAAGTIFRVDASGTFSTLYSFQVQQDGAIPTAGLLLASDGKFYGTTQIGGDHDLGTVFVMDAAFHVSPVHSFAGPDGAAPAGALIEAADGNFYGTTPGGGASGHGTVYKFGPSTPFVVVHDFQYSEGTRPASALVQALDGNLYGTAPEGGVLVDGLGTVYRVEPDGSTSAIHVFDYSQGFRPGAGLLLASDGAFYGTTASGGVGGFGTAFRISASVPFSTIHHFSPGEGFSPQSALIEGSDGELYGTAYSGGVQSLFGSLFRLSKSGDLTVLHTFTGPDGANPAAALLQIGGDLFGTTASGGSGSAGGVFRLEQGGLNPVHDFAGTDGSTPLAKLLNASDGALYGTTSFGGDTGFGTIFRINDQGFAKVFDFDGTQGSNPAVALIESAGALYGTAQFGGTNGNGSIFRLDDSGVTPLRLLDSADGVNPSAALVVGPDGAFYGTTPNGGPGFGGTIYRIDAEGNFSVVHPFDYPDGGHSTAELVVGPGGALYGTAQYGGPAGAGVVFRLGDAAIAVNEVLPSSGSAADPAALEVLGGGFVEGATVAFGGSAAQDVQFVGSVYLAVRAPVLSPGALYDVTVTNPGAAPNASATLPEAFFADFVDLSRGDLFHDYVERVFRAGITAGCGGGAFCRDAAVTRAQMAVFLLKAEHGAAYQPPTCAGAFGDVTCPSPFADWIERLAAEGITGGCGGNNYCPASPVTRAQMAAFLLKTEHGASYAPPACAGLFADVACPSLFADWIEQVAAEKVTGGCGGGNYCPDSPNTRGQMAVFLAKAVLLP